jgi:ribosomal protein S18 acetylase RimI-like enzyme
VLVLAVANASRASSHSRCRHAARSFPALYADPRDRQLLGVAGPAQDREKLLYVLTLGVAEVRGLVCGCKQNSQTGVAAQRRGHPSTERDLLRMQAFQRRGIARRLLDSMMRSAAEAGCRAVYLHVARFNDAARAFYRAAGFSELAVLPSFYTIRTARQPLPGCDRYDACVLGLVITPSPPTPWHAVNLAVQPLTAVISSLNSCLLWGSERQGQQLNGAEAAGGAGEAGPAAAPAHCHIVEIEGATSWPGARPEDTRQPQNQQQASRFCLPGDPEYLSRHWSPVQPQPRPQPASGPPAWLRHMFIRH